MNDLKTYTLLADKFLVNSSPNVINNFRKISSFITDATKAKDSKELSNVVEAYAQPPLSFKLTRKSIMSIDVNAYLGLWGGTEFSFEKVQGANDEEYRNFKPAAGLTVPVGFSFTWGNTEKNITKIKNKLNKSRTDSRLFSLNRDGKPILLTGTSHTFFISIIDIAGPVSFRLGNDSAKGLPQDTKWAQILAPGIHYISGLKNSPISVSLGFQISPQLRSYRNINSSPFTTGRFQIGVTYDMPLINLKRQTAF